MCVNILTRDKLDTKFVDTMPYKTEEMIEDEIKMHEAIIDGGNFE